MLVLPMPRLRKALRTLKQGPTCPLLHAWVGVWLLFLPLGSHLWISPPGSRGLRRVPSDLPRQEPPGRATSTPPQVLGLKQVWQSR